MKGRKGYSKNIEKSAKNKKTEKIHEIKMDIETNEQKDNNLVTLNVADSDSFGKDDKKNSNNNRADTITTIISILLVLVSFSQLMTYRAQAEIATNANKLAQYEYRFEFYQDLSELQRYTAKTEYNPQIEVEEFSEVTYNILALIRESEMLFDKNISDRINKVLNEHLEYLINAHNIGTTPDEYNEKKKELIKEYGAFLRSEDFMSYLDIKKIQ